MPRAFFRDVIQPRVGHLRQGSLAAGMCELPHDAPKIAAFASLTGL
jgi:hypothetical protein